MKNELVANRKPELTIERIGHQHFGIKRPNTQAWKNVLALTVCPTPMKELKAKANCKTTFYEQFKALLEQGKIFRNEFGYYIA